MRIYGKDPGSPGARLLSARLPTPTADGTSGPLRDLRPRAYRRALAIAAVPSPQKLTTGHPGMGMVRKAGDELVRASPAALAWIRPLRFHRTRRTRECALMTMRLKGRGGGKPL